MDRKRVVFYIDGFNFYYGLKSSMQVDKKWGNAYWIDVVRLCEGFISPQFVRIAIMLYLVQKKRKQM